MLCIVALRVGIPRFALITAPVLTFLFTGRDAAITMNSVKITLDITIVLLHAVRWAITATAELLVLIAIL